MNRFRVSCAVAAMVAAPSLAGDLNPPPGPVAPSMLTLDEIETSTPLSAENTTGDADSVFRVVTPGSYHLTADLVVDQAGFSGIEIAASGVTIDLRGFTIRLFADAEDAITKANGVQVADVTVRNGRILGDGTGRYAVLLGVVDRAVVEDVRAVNVYGGIFVGDSGRIERCVVQQVSDAAFGIGSGGTVLDCIARAGATSAFAVGKAAIVERCSAFDFQSGSAFNGVLATGAQLHACRAISTLGFSFDMSESVLIADCSIELNGGFYVGRGGAVTRCRLNRGSGIGTGDGCRVEGCVLTDSISGITTNDDSVVSDCSVTNVIGDGISVGTGCTVERCLLVNCLTAGVFFGEGSVVRDCTVRDTFGGGFVGDNARSSLVRGCVAIRCNGFGVDMLERSEGARIEHCTVADGDGYNLGFGVTLSDSTIESGGVGIQAGPGCRIERCEINDVSQSGITTVNTCDIIDCTINDAGGYGILASDGASVQRCVVRAATICGIRASVGSVIRDCNIMDSGSHGIMASEGVTVEDCVVSSNAGIGIAIGGDSVVAGNTCEQNGGAGIEVTGDGLTEIDGNTCKRNAQGIVSNSTAGNIITRNVCAGNASFAGPPANFVTSMLDHVGPIRTSPAGADARDNYSY